MYAVGMLGSYLTQGVYAVAGPFQPFGGAVDIIVVQQEDGTFKSSPWYVKFGDFQGVIKRQEKCVDISVNDVPADFHMILDSKGEAYFEKEVEPDEGTCSVLPDGSSFENDQEGGVDRIDSNDAGVDACSHKQEAQGSTTVTVLPDCSNMVDTSEVKDTMQEEHRAAHEEQVSGAIDDLHHETEDGRETSQLSSEILEVYNREGGLEAACTENDSSCMELIRTQEERRVAKEQAIMISSGDGLQPDLTNVRVASNMNSQVGFELYDMKFNGEARVSEDDLCSTDVRRTVHPPFEAIADFEEMSLANEDSEKPDGDNDVGTVVKEGSMLQNMAISAMEKSSLQEVPDVGATEHHPSDSIFSHKDDPCLVEMWAEDAFEGLKSDQNCWNNSNGDINVDEDEVFASFECVAVEGEREQLIYSCDCNMPCDCGMNRDSLSWDFETSVNQALNGESFPLSQSGTIIPEEILGNADADSASLKKEEIDDSNTTGEAGSSATLASVSSPSKWRLWPFLLRWSRIEKASSLSNQALLAAASVAMRTSFTDGFLQKSGYLKWQQKTKVRTYVPTSMQLASLNLKDGPNKVTFTFSSVLGKTQVDARIYLWKWSTKIVISDVDGTITKSDVLGQVMPLVGRDWSQYGVTRLFSAIKDNGYEVLFLSARAISQAYLTRRFLLNLKQDGEALPEGPVFISPDGLIPSLYREVIRRAPHEFKISCLEGIRELFPKDVNPFYAGFGNRETDEISYLKVGIPKGKIFIINPKGEVVVNHRVDCKSYTSLHALVDVMFPPMSSQEQEEFNDFNHWKVPLPDIEDELSAKSFKSVKKVGSSKA